MLSSDSEKQNILKIAKKFDDQLLSGAPYNLRRIT
ncbi:unnamed protein product [Amoebophrya sp. A25]|nr:unnamed protein product [Amoebophrya sp. A25]|eukprot:GSA25T00002447001.1